MHPAIAFKSIGAFPAGYKYQVIKTASTYVLGICYPVVIIQITVVTGRTYKFSIKDGNKIVIDVHILIHSPQELDDAFILYPVCIGSPDDFTALQRFFLIIIIRDRFGKVRR